MCCQATAPQPQKQQGKYLNVDLPDISQLSPQLQREWHPANNALLGGIKIKPHSNKKVMWSCPNCPAGCPHIWETTVHERTEGTKCPYCEGRKVCEHNSLATQAPSQLKYWKNAKVPEQTLAGSNFRAEWKCPTCSLMWQANVAQQQRVQHARGCPHCNRIGSVTHSQRLKQRNIRCCLNGTLSATSRTAFIHKPPPLAAKSLCTGSVTSVPRERCTCTK